MKQKVNHMLWCLSLICLCSLTACKSIIEEDISDKNVIVNSPNSSTLSSYNQLFWWEKLDGALNYQLQIATPSFSSIQQLVLDTLITTNKVTYTLASGTYEWRVRALNGSYETPYNGSTFTILDADLNTQYVLLKSPSSGASVNSLLLSWYSIPVQGVGYQIQISKSSTLKPTVVDEKTQITTFNATTITEEATYYWQVRAFKGTDTSYWSTPNSFVYDVTVPGKPVLTGPANSTTSLVPTTGSLTWTGDAGSKYYVFITYGTDAEQRFTVSSTNYSYSAGVNQTVKWRVQAFDAANNVGLTSDTWTFKTGTATQ